MAKAKMTVKPSFLLGRRFLFVSHYGFIFGDKQGQLPEW